MKILRIVAFIVASGWLGTCTADAATRFISGYRDGIWVYGVIERNDVQYRTDQTGARTNQILFDELSAEDKMRLAKTYSWMTHRLASHFGNDGRDTINAFVNDQTGWSALVEALKNKHAKKEYPELAEAFGPDVTLDLPSINVTCWDVINSSTYSEFVRLKNEIKDDFDIGRQIYTMLVNAKWDQVSIAVKGLSGPLIQVIVDNFITGFVVHGAHYVSDLSAAVQSFNKDLRAFIKGRFSEGSAPPSAADFIAKLDEYLAKMEGASLTAKELVNRKKAQLQALADQLDQMEEDALEARRGAAEETRTTLQAFTETLPEPNVPNITPDPVPENVPEEEREVWIFTNMHNKAYPIWQSILEDTNSVQADIEKEQTELVNQYGSVSVPNLGEPFEYCYDGMTSGFDGRYRNVTVTFDTFDPWDLGPASTACNQAQSLYDGIDRDSRDHIDKAIPRIDPIHARALGMDPYAKYLGTIDTEGNIQPMDPPPGERFKNTGILDFDTIIDIIATPDQELAKTIEDIDDRKSILDAADSNMADGIEQRIAWVKAQYTIYLDLIFNFENSLSYVIAALKQIDRLHEDPYFKKDSPYAIYDGVTLYTYAINIDHILAEIATLGTDSVRLQSARQAALKKLFGLHSQEQALIQKLAIAQDSHINDAQALFDFYRALAAQYTDTSSLSKVFQDVEDITGFAMKTQYDAWNDLVPDITYYYLGDDNWIRTPESLGTSVFARDIYGNPSPYGRITGKTETYFSVYDLYHDMKTEKASLLALSETDFNAWMTQTTIDLDKYENRLQTEGVYGPGWPCWELLYAVNNLQESINGEYRHGTPLPPPYYQVHGQLKTEDGLGVEDIDLIMDGYYGEDGSGAHVTFQATTGVRGHFLFEFIGTGNYTITPSDTSVRRGMGSSGLREMQFNIETTAVEMRGTDLSVNVVATPTPESGNYVTGWVKDAQGSGTGGKTMVLESLETGDISSKLTLDDGFFSFMGLPEGTYNLRPVEQGFQSNPSDMNITVPTSKTGLIFVMSDGPIQCAECNGEKVTLTNVTFSPGVNCECSAATSITFETNVTIEDGANITFKAPIVRVKSKFNAKKGSVVNIKHP